MFALGQWCTQLIHTEVEGLERWLASVPSPYTENMHFQLRISMEAAGFRGRDYFYQEKLAPKTSFANQFYSTLAPLFWLPSFLSSWK